MFPDEPDEEETLILLMCRMQRDPAQGFIPEPVTCRQFVLDRVKYCSHMLASLWLDDMLAFTEVFLPDLEEEIFSFHALVAKGAKEEFAETCRIITHNRLVEARKSSTLAQKHSVTFVRWGYNMAPVGVCDFLGYRSDTAAWLVLHPRGPALLVRYGDAATEDNVNTWLEFWSNEADYPRRWPRDEDGPELCVHEAMRQLTTLSKRKRRSKQAGRFIIR